MGSWQSWGECACGAYSGPNDSSGYDKPFPSQGCAGPEPVDTTSVATHGLDRPPAFLETHTTCTESEKEKPNIFFIILPQKDVNENKLHIST